MDNLLSKFLNVGLLPHLDTNERLAYVESAIDEVNKKLSKNRVNLIRYTLTALNPDVSEEQSVIRETDEALRKYWKTIRVNIPDSPRQILRAIIWEALNRQSKDDTAAVIIWLTASSLLQHIALDSNERDLITEFLLSLRDKTERRAVAEWQKPQLAKPALESLSADFDGIEVPTVIDATFAKDIIKACGPNDIDGSAIPGANPNLPSSNANTNASWAEQFADQMTKAIGKRIDNSSASLAQALQTELKVFTEGLEKHLSGLSQNVFNGKNTESLRGDLLWWRQALYSNNLKSGYRDVESIEAAFFMGFDLHRLLPVIHPISVEYLLREAFRASHNEQSQEQIKLSVALEHLTSSPKIRFIEKEIAHYYKNWDEPLPLLAQIKKDIVADISNQESLASIGLDKDTEVALEDLSVWFFRELQAHRLATQK
jgi:hypothetical protein